MSGTINLALSQQFDMDGDPLSGGRLFFFAAGTSTPQNAFQDTALTLPHPNPLILDASGRIAMFYLADGQIKIRLEDEGGLTIIAADNLLVIGPSTGGASTGGGVDANTILQTGDVKARYGTGSHTGFVRCNGATIGNSASSSSELADATAEALFKYLWTTALPMLTSAGGAAVKTTAAADWTGNNRMTLPDLRGRTISGMDDMGAAAAGRLTATYWGTAGTTLGNAGGSESRALVTANMAAHTHSGTSGNQNASHTHSGTTGGNNSSLAHTHSLTQTGNSLNNINVTGANSAAGTAATSTGGTDSGDLNHVHDFTTGNQSANHQHPFTTDNGTGTATPVAVASPSLVMTWYMKL